VPRTGDCPVTTLADSTWPEMAQATGLGCWLAVPMGATEQHGPHLPLTTDTDIAVAITERAASRDGRLVVAPPLAYGASGEHQAFPGTVSIGQDAAHLLLLELGRSAVVAFDRVVVVSTHGGNVGPVARAMRQLAEEGHPVTSWSPTWAGDLHAGRTETSLMLAIHPDRVHLDRAESGDRRPLEEILPALHSGGVRSVSPNGVLGDPTGATAEEGRRLLDDAVDALLAAVQHLAQEMPIDSVPVPLFEEGRR
jgi:mycofactocin precursor peptide peptidase